MGKAAKKVPKSLGVRLTVKKKVLQRNGISKVDTSKPSAAPVAEGGRNYTVSIALPGSIIANAQRLEWKTSLAGQVIISIIGLTNFRLAVRWLYFVSTKLSFIMMGRCQQKIKEE